MAGSYHDLPGKFEIQKNSIAADVVDGIKGKSLRFGSGDRLAVRVSQPQCYCSSDYCNGKITLSFWIMTFSESVQHIVTPENNQNTGVICLSYSYIMQCHYRSPGIKLLIIESTSTLVQSEWTHVALVMDLNVGGSIFLNGILDGFRDISEAESHPDTHYPSCSTVYFGGKYSATEYPMDTNADEFKYFYDALSPTGNNKYVSVLGATSRVSQFSFHKYNFNTSACE